MDEKLDFLEKIKETASKVLNRYYNDLEDYIYAKDKNGKILGKDIMENDDAFDVFEDLFIEFMVRLEDFYQEKIEYDELTDSEIDSLYFDIKNSFDKNLMSYLIKPTPLPEKMNLRDVADYLNKLLLFIETSGYLPYSPTTKNKLPNYKNKLKKLIDALTRVQKVIDKIKEMKK